MGVCQITVGWRQALFQFPPLSPRAPASQAIEKVISVNDLFFRFVHVKIEYRFCIASLISESQE